MLMKITRKHIHQRVILMNIKNNSRYLSRVRLVEMALREITEPDESRIVVMQVRGILPPSTLEDEGVWFRCDHWKVWTPG